jgi:hypothetical protein
MRRRMLAVAVAAMLCGCGGGSGGDASEQVFNFSLGSVSVAPANPGGPYAGRLAGCIVRRRLRASESCTFEQLPLLGQQVGTPQVDDVMDRVLVSHPWMGDRFRQLLGELPPETMVLFNAVTGIVISADLVPSFQSCITGAVYLDADLIWVAREEADTISDTPDYRSGFGRDLSYVSPARYVRNGMYAASRTAPRTLEDARNELAPTLYHELAHANDAFPPARRAALHPDRRIALACADGAGHRVSDNLQRSMPLRSRLLYDLAAVLFRGRPATAALRAVQPETVAGEFAGDGANDHYNYTNQFEDTAMLFEELMTLYALGIDRDVGFTTVPTSPPVSANDYRVVWGQRNRIGDSQVKVRARLVAAAILPSLDLDGFIDDLPAPRSLRVGAGWAESIALDEGGGAAAGALADRIDIIRRHE